MIIYSHITPSRREKMAATMACRFGLKLNHLISYFKYLNCSQHQTFTDQKRQYISFGASWFVEPKNGSPPPTSSGCMFQKPKYPSNVFIMYLNKIISGLQKDNPGANRKELVSKIAQMWKELDPEEKAKLGLQRKEMLENYKAQLKLYQENITPDQIHELESDKSKNLMRKRKKERKALGLPKKPIGAFGIYVSEKFGERTNETVAEYFKALTDHWNVMSASEKEVFMKKAEENRKAYQEKIAQWEKEMMSLGRFDLVRKSSLQTMTQVKRKRSQPKTSTNNDEK
ncbi:hypothetical protein Btru_058935 [Bulinus truncatus]|nr:hypothetical protein Btru_058935 [Bulinus truncatus]